jgi:hypothetical protein
MHCQNCGTVLPDGTPSCPTCGMKFAAPQPAPQPSPQPAQPAYPAGEPAPTHPFPPQQPPAYAPQAAPPVYPPQGAPAYPPQQPPVYAPQPSPPAYPPQAAPPVYPPQQPPPAYPPQAYAPQSPPPAPAPAPKKKHTGLIIGIVVAALVLIAGAVFAVLLFLPVNATRTISPAYAPVKPTVSTTSTDTLDTADNTAAENVVTSFYDAINSGNFAAVSALVTSDTKSAVDKGAFEGWSKTTIEFARSVVDGDSAEVYGRESQREFGSAARGVEFVLQRVSGEWLIQTWMAVDEQTLKGTPATSGTGNGTATLNDGTARDVVSSLLQARQGGDAQSIRMLTTAKFQNDNSAVWLDGVDNTPYFTAFSIKNVVQKGTTFIVTVTEQWNSGAETGTYTVVDQGGAILVDAWSSK